MIGIVRAPIDLAALQNEVKDDRFGALVLFCGVVRERSDDGRAVTGLSYESYEHLALLQMQEISREVQARFGPCALAMVHRIGELAVGEIAVAVAVGTEHRAQAFDACEYAIDELKRRVEIWKKEAYADGGAQWQASCT